MNYVTQLTFFRFLAAVLVVVFHYGHTTYPFNTSLIRQLLSHGQVAVSFFFFLSGVVLTINYLNAPNLSFKSFFLKRIARIYPIYILAFASTLLLTIFINGSRPSVISIILQAFSVHAWVPKFALQINYPSWSIAVEVFFYLLFPVLVQYLNKKAFDKQILLIVVFWIISTTISFLLNTYYYQPNTTNFGKFLMYFPLLHLNTFLVGILAGIVLLKFKEKAEKLRWFSRLSYLLGMVIIFLLFTNKTSLALYMNNGLLSPLFFMIIVGIAFDVSPLTKTLSNKFLVFLGNSSYSIYILQYPVYILMQTVLQEKVFQGKAFYLYLTTLLLISGLLYTFFEKKARFLLLSRWQLTKK